ncbi:MAG: hypothetical protein R6V00_10735 [Candidatus Aminicenantes bacterium]
MKKAYYVFFVVFIIANQLIFASIKIKLVDRFSISQEKAYLTAYDFSVTEDEIFIIPHTKEGHLKLYKNTGVLYKTIGRKGPGPEEFVLPGPCDYKDPLFAILDTGKHKVLVLNRTKNNDFKRKDEIFCLGAPQNIKLYRNKIIIGDYIGSKEGKNYSLYMKDFNDQKIHYLLPSYAKYGLSSNKEYERKYEGIKMATSGYALFDVYGDHVYYAWEGQAKIIKIDLKTKKRDVFGKDTENYIKPSVTSKIRKAYEGILEGKVITTERMKMSWIRGVFADERYSIILYTNLDKELDLWRATLQFYDSEGEYIKEVNLPDAVDYRHSGPACFYDHENHYLYILVARLNKEDFMDEYEILKYEIR